MGGDRGLSSSSSCTAAKVVDFNEAFCDLTFKIEGIEGPAEQLPHAVDDEDEDAVSALDSARPKSDRLTFLFPDDVVRVGGDELLLLAPLLLVGDRNDRTFMVFY